MSSVKSDLDSIDGNYNGTIHTLGADPRLIIILPPYIIENYTITFTGHKLNIHGDRQPNAGAITSTFQNGIAISYDNPVSSDVGKSASLSLSFTPK